MSEIMRPSENGEFQESGYLAAVLDPESHELLKNAIRIENYQSDYPKIYCHHMTMAFKPSREIWQKYIDLGLTVGSEVSLTVTGFYQDKRAVAVSVTGCESENNYPHITICCDENTAPVYSNRLLAKTDAKKEMSKISNLTLKATVQFVPF